MFSKSCHVRDRSEIFRKLVPCVWAGVGKSPFSELRRQPWLDVEILSLKCFGSRPVTATNPVSNTQKQGLSSSRNLMTSFNCQRPALVAIVTKIWEFWRKISSVWVHI